MVLGQEIDYWIVPALGFSVLADNDALGGGGFTRAFGGDEATLDKEEYSRDVQEVLRGDANAYRLRGVAIDANLTSAEQGASAGPFITFTIIAVLVVVGSCCARTGQWHSSVGRSPSSWSGSRGSRTSSGSRAH